MKPYERLWELTVANEKLRKVTEAYKRLREKPFTSKCAKKQYLAKILHFSISLPIQGHQSVSGHHSSGVGNLGTYANICMGDPELGDLTIAEMSPEDIRAELKR